jgi:general secretion pathway protein H
VGRVAPRADRSVEAGFTLLEILIVLVIIAMAATLVAPAVDSGLRAREVRSAVRTLAGTMRTLQAEAVRTGAVQSLAIDPVANVVQVGGGREIALGETARIADVRGGELLAGGVVSVRFYPNGSNTGVDVLVGERGVAADEGFVVHADALIGVISVFDPRA